MDLNFSNLKNKFGIRYIIALCAIFGILFYLLVFSNLRQAVTDFTEGSLASQTIRATKTIENKSETEEKRKVAENSVVPAYKFDTEIGINQVENTKRLIDYIKETKEEINKQYEAAISANNAEKNKVEAPKTEDYLANLNSRFEKLNDDDLSFYSNLPNNLLSDLFTLSEAELTEVKEQLTPILTTTMNEAIREDGLSAAKKAAQTSISKLSLNEGQENVSGQLIQYAIIPNEFLDEKKTQELKAAARENISPVMIYHGEVIVREGVQIDARAMKKLDLLGMTNKDATIFPYVALALLIFLQMLSLGWIVYKEENEQKSFRFFHVYLFLMAIALLLMKGLSMFQSESAPFIPLLLPAALVPLVLNLFISRRASILFALFQVCFALFIFYDLAGTSNLLLIISSLMFTGIMGTLLQRTKLNNQIGKALVWLVVLPVLFVLILVIYQGMSLNDASTWSALICILVGSVLSYVLSISLHPYIDLLLNDDSMMVLNELSNPNHPLLKKLLEEAPGTYHHSMMVASLSSNAVAAIGGRSLVTRVACYYHDIGKIKYANFFVENLPTGADNPHNFLLPEDSKEIIFSHVTDGVKMLQEAGMPQMIVDICQQHHGTTLMKYFYSKALERNSEIKEDEFRYPGPKPQTKEAAVVNIADTCEAGVRAMKQPTKESITEFVNNTIDSRIQDGQLDESGITLGELRIVEHSIINGLCSTFHSRIEYPKFKNEIEGKSK